MQFSNTSDNSGIAQQARTIARVDSTQWSNEKIANSVNNYLDMVNGYLIATDTKFNFDDSNHTKLPIGTTNLVANQSDYSFLTDEQGNKILTLTRIDLLGSDGLYHKLDLIDQNEIDVALDEYEKTAGTPTKYDKIADNIIRLYPKPSTSITSGLKFYFQRSSSYVTSIDTTKEIGIPVVLHRGAVIFAAYDCALTLGLENLSVLATEMQREEQKMITYFKGRNKDEKRRIIAFAEDNR